ncbi:MAG: biotin-dependent carboxyltransferase family protein [Nocardioidaceae bacterium]
MSTIDVISPGIQSTVQDADGRVGHRRRGFSLSGPCDAYALRAANLCVGNDAGQAAIEIPMGRFTATVLRPCVVAVTGADETPASLNGETFPSWEGVLADAGDELEISTVRGPGFRAYLAVTGGIDVPQRLGSRSTHTRAHLGGFQGRPLRRGDLLSTGGGAQVRRRVPLVSRPTYASEWEIEVVKGPYADPDYLTAADWELMTSATWRIDLNSDRSGTRLVGPRFAWARSDGGDGGAHPSNMVDGPYPRGGVLMNGDVPTILGPDSPVSGGFVTIATVPRSALWKVGQLRPGTDTVRFREVSPEQSARMAAAQDAQLTANAMEEL